MIRASSMRPWARIVVLALIAVGTSVAAAALPFESSSPHPESSLCTLLPGGTHAVLRVEQDTTLALGSQRQRPMSFSGVPASPRDSLLATPGTPMPAARVRLLQLDSATRAELAKADVTDSQPVAFILAAPYRADCRTVRWTDSIPFVVRGEVGYVRGTLASREGWINGAPLLVVPDAWFYPYPRRRGLAFNALPGAKLAPPEAFFSIDTLVDLPDFGSEEFFEAERRALRQRALAWAGANLDVADLEPVRRILRSAVLDPDWSTVLRIPSRLRGTYRVDIEASGKRVTWFFRSHDRPGYPWNPAESVTTASRLVASPFVNGYSLVGRPAASRDSLPTAMPRGAGPMPRLWLAAGDRPTAPDNDTRHALSGMLEFTLSAVPESIWNDLELFERKPTPAEAALMARLPNRVVPRSEKQPQLPILIRLDGGGGVRAETTLVKDGRTVRVAIQRLDTISIRQSW